MIDLGQLTEQQLDGRACIRCGQPGPNRFIYIISESGRSCGEWGKADRHLKQQTT